MRGNTFGVITLVGVVGWTLPVSGQTVMERATTGAPGHFVSRWTPYTAEFKQTWVRKQADGRTTTHEMTEIEARNSQGLEMHSSTNILPSGDPAPMTSFTVNEIATQIHTNWNVARPDENATLAHTATIVYPPDPDAVRSCASHAAASMPSTVADKPMNEDPGPAMEDLGTRTFQGIEAHGHKFKTTAQPCLFTIGSTEPNARSFEQWTATDTVLGPLTVHQIIDDPQVHYTKELVSLTQDEPDPTLFQPPAD
jgi:hypothetical protein